MPPVPLATTLAVVALVAAVGAPPDAPQSRSVRHAPDTLPVRGVSRELARHRAARLGDVRYDLALDVTRSDTARGRVVVRFRRIGGGDVWLDFRGPKLGEVVVNGAPLSPAAYDGAHVRLPAAALRLGANAVALEFTAPIAPAGASIIRFHDPADGAEYLYTLLVPSDASLLFPCFDQPDLKARVTLALTVPAGWRALANGPAVDSTSAPGGSTTLRFRETEPISTYLVAFAAGPWTVLRTSASRRPVSLFVRASRAREVEADSIVLANDRAVSWLTSYFAVPYPFRKLDVLLAPAFPFGGMEHPGAIFYNEERFVFRERPTTLQRQGRTATIYHEIAHQWFGDLVTMQWFDDLWLKEGFATYMAAKMQAALDPASEAWKTFYSRNKPAAYAVDASAGTTPVWQELANLDQAKSNYGAIVYNKAPGVLKQLDYVVGDHAFRDGLRRYLRAHAFGNATWHDLLASIGAASGRSLHGWGEQYVLRPGMPVIEQHVTVRDGTVQRLQLVQRPARPLSGAGAWPIRTEVVLYYPDAPPVRIPVSLSDDTTEVRAAVGRRTPAFVFANAGDHAYALVLLDERSVAWLEDRIGSVGDAFLRAMVWGALWDLVREAQLAPERFVRLALRELASERDEPIVSALVAHVVRATTAYLSAPARDSVQAQIEHSLRAGADDAALPYGIRKPQLDALVRVTRTPGGIAYLDSVLARGTVLGDRLRPPTRWAIVTRLVELGAPSADRRLAEAARADASAEGRRRLFAAGAARPSPAVKREYFGRYFADTTLNEEWVTSSLAEFNSLDQQALSLPYVVPALDSLSWIQRNRRIFFLGSWIGAFVTGQTDARALATVQHYVETHPGLPRDLREKILQSADELERAVRIRRAFGGQDRLSGAR